MSRLNRKQLQYLFDTLCLLIDVTDNAKGFKHVGTKTGELQTIREYANEVARVFNVEDIIRFKTAKTKPKKSAKRPKRSAK